MASANAEAQRRWRERQKQKRQEELKLPDAKAEAKLFQRPFFEALHESPNWTNVEISFDCMGLEAPQFDDDSGPKSFTGMIEQGFLEAGEEPFRGATNSLARAEVIAGNLIDAAVELIGIINTYKRKEIQQRIAEIEKSDLTDPAVRKAALAQIVRLSKLLDQLGKQIRWPFKQWKTDET
jgi:hypothetical protein